MLLKVVFGIYLAVLIAVVIMLSIAQRRLQSYIPVDSRAISMLLPLIINFLLANTTFYNISPIFTMMIPGVICYLISKKLQNVRIIGLTGGTGSGKPILVKMIQLKLKHLQILDCQKLLTNQLKKGRNGYEKIIKLFNNSTQRFLDLQTSQIQHQKLLDYLYQSKKNLASYENVVTSIYFFTVIKQIIVNIVMKKNYIMLISSRHLLHSAVLRFICYPVVLVDCADRLKIQRACKQWNCSQQQAKQRLSLETSVSIKRKKCQQFIQNNQSEQDLLQDFLTVVNPYLRKKKQAKPHKKH